MSKTKDNGKKSFVMYASFLEAMKHLNDAEYRECMTLISEYAFNGIEEKSSSPLVNIILEMAKPNLEAAKLRYDACVENGKKGAEFGKLGGAPKGNQNARKKQPLIQPLKQPLNVDLDANVNVEEDINENENEKVNVNENDDNNMNVLLGATELQSSFSNSSESSIIDAITLEDADLEGDLSHPNSRSDVTTSSGKDETLSYPKGNSNHKTGSPCITKSGSSAARRQQEKDEGMDIGEYMEQCLIKYILKLADMRQGTIPTDDNVFWKAVNLYKELHYGVDDKKAIKEVTRVVNEYIKQSS